MEKQHRLLVSVFGIDREEDTYPNGFWEIANTGDLVVKNRYGDPVAGYARGEWIKVRIQFND